MYNKSNENWLFSYEDFFGICQNLLGFFLDVINIALFEHPFKLSKGYSLPGLFQVHAGPGIPLKKYVLSQLQHGIFLLCWGSWVVVSNLKYIQKAGITKKDSVKGQKYLSLMIACILQRVAVRVNFSLLNSHKRIISIFDFVITMLYSIIQNSPLVQLLDIPKPEY